MSRRERTGLDFVWRKEVREQVKRLSSKMVVLSVLSSRTSV